MEYFNAPHEKWASVFFTAAAIWLAIVAGLLLL
jgi:hypothetical protein